MVAPRWKNIVNILNALACFLITICYLFFSAIPNHNTPTWEASVDVLNSVPVPALAFLLPHIDPQTTYNPVELAPNTEDGDLQAYVFVNTDVQPYNTTGSRYSESITLEAYSTPFTAVVANSSRVWPTLNNPIASGLTATLAITCMGTFSVLYSSLVRSSNT